MTRPMVDAIISMAEKDRFSKGIFGWVGFDIKWLEYENIDRVAGHTKWSFKKLLKYALGGIEDFSSVPLKINLFFTALAFVSTLGLGTWMIVYAILGKYIPLLLSISSVISLFSMFIFIGLAVISAYIKKFIKSQREDLFTLLKKKIKRVNLFIFLYVIQLQTLQEGPLHF